MITEETTNNEQLKKLIDELKNGIIPLSIKEDMRLVDENSTQGKIFQKEGMSITKKFYPELIKKYGKVRFIISDIPDQDLGATLKYHLPPVVILSKGLFKNLTEDNEHELRDEESGVIQKKSFKGSYERYVHAIGHELSHKKFSLELGDGENSKEEETLMDLLPIQKMHDNNMNIDAALENMAYFAKNGSKLTDIYKALFDVHMNDPNRFKAVSTEIARLKHGYTKKPIPLTQVNKKFKRAFAEATHISYFDVRKKQVGYEDLSVAQKLEFIAEEVKNLDNEARVKEVKGLLKNIKVNPNDKEQIAAYTKLSEALLPDVYAFNSLFYTIHYKFQKADGTHLLTGKLAELSDKMQQFVDAKSNEQMFASAAGVMKIVNTLDISSEGLDLKKIDWPNFDLTKINFEKLSILKPVTPPWDAHITKMSELSAVRKTLLLMGIFDPRMHSSPKIKDDQTLKELVSLSDKKFLPISCPKSEDHSYYGVKIDEEGKFIKLEDSLPYNYKYGDTVGRGTQSSLYIYHKFHEPLSNKIEFLEAKIFFEQTGTDNKVNLFLQDPKKFGEYLELKSQRLVLTEGQNKARNEANKLEVDSFLDNLHNIITEACKINFEDAKKSLDHLCNTEDLYFKLPILAKINSITDHLLKNKELLSETARNNVIKNIVFLGDEDKIHINWWRSVLDYKPPQNTSEFCKMLKIYAKVEDEGHALVVKKAEIALFLSNHTVDINQLLRKVPEELGNILNSQGNFSSHKEQIKNYLSFNKLTADTYNFKKVIFEKIRHKFKPPENLIDKIKLFKIMDKAKSFPDIEFKEYYENAIIKSLNSTEDQSLKLAATKEILYGRAVLDSKLKNEAIRLLVDIEAAKFGTDDGSKKYTNNIKPEILEIEKNTQKQITYEVLNLLADKIKTQRAPSSGSPRNYHAFFSG